MTLLVVEMAKTLILKAFSILFASKIAVSREKIFDFYRRESCKNKGLAKTSGLCYNEK